MQFVNSFDRFCTAYLNYRSKELNNTILYTFIPYNKLYIGARRNTGTKFHQEKFKTDTLICVAADR